MKTLKAILAGALVLALAACQIPFSGTGSLKIQLPGGARAAAGSTGDLVRLQLTRNGVVIPLSGGDYIEKVLAGQTVSLDGLSPGPGYNILVSTGLRNAGETFYRTKLFQKSEPFEISAGTDTSVNLTLSASRFTVLESVAGSAHGATTDSNGSILIYLNGAGTVQVSNGGVSTNIPVSNWSNLGSATVNGLGYNNAFLPATLWINTTKGIFESTPPSSTIGSMPMSDSNNATITPVVTESGSVILHDSATTQDNKIAYYAGSGMTAGIRVNTDPKWQTLTDLLSLDSMSSLKDTLSKSGQVIRGFASASPFAYLSTAIGTYRIPAELIAGTTQGLGNSLKDGKDANGVSIIVEPDDGSLIIGPVSVFSDGASKAVAFGGTVKGLFASAVDPLKGIPQTPSGHLGLVAGTPGLNISQVATSAVKAADGTVYTAAYSANTRELLLLKDLAVVDHISAFEGLPSGSLKFTWYVTTVSSVHTLHLVASGGDATVQLEVATW